MENKVLLTFDETSKHLILSRFGIKVDDDGYLIDQKTSKRILSVDEAELKEEHLAGITKGSIKLYDSETTSLFKLVEAIYK